MSQRLDVRFVLIYPMCCTTQSLFTAEVQILLQPHATVTCAPPGMHLHLQAVYTSLREAEYRSTAFVPYWNVPLLRAIVPRQRRCTEALKIINATLDGLIQRCKDLVEEEEQEFVEEFVGQQDPSILHFLLASGDQVGPDTTPHSTGVCHNASFAELHVCPAAMLSQDVSENCLCCKTHILGQGALSLFTVLPGCCSQC